MSKKFTVIHRKDPNNVGDIASNPLQYFLKEDEYETFDITEIRKKPIPFGPPIIVGGGGLIANEFFGDLLRDVTISNDKLQLYEMYENRWKLCNPINRDVNKKFEETYKSLIHETINQIKEDKSLKILWGAGHNGEMLRKSKEFQLKYPDYILDFNLVGIRDYDQDYQWVPCASCMHPALRKSYSIKNEVIWFEHKKQLIKDFGTEPIPRFINTGSNIEQTIELLGSANVILTNSYHGAYWGILLKKRVIVVGPWSSKFTTFKHKPYMVDKLGHWSDIIDECLVYEDSLDECINVTESFWKSIQQKC